MLTLYHGLSAQDLGTSLDMRCVPNNHSLSLDDIPYLYLFMCIIRTVPAFLLDAPFTLNKNLEGKIPYAQLVKTHPNLANLRHRKLEPFCPYIQLISQL